MSDLRDHGKWCGHESTAFCFEPDDPDRRWWGCTLKTCPGGRAVTDDETIELAWQIRKGRIETMKRKRMANAAETFAAALGDTE